jgi:hypothetical protein
MGLGGQGEVGRMLWRLISGLFHSVKSLDRISSIELGRLCSLAE